MTTDPRHHGRNEHPRIVRSEIEDPPPLTNEDGDWEDEEVREQSRRIKPLSPFRKEIGVAKDLQFVVRTQDLLNIYLY